MGSVWARPRTLVAIAVAVLAFLVLGAAWSLASPPMSAADDDFHVASIVCARGNSNFCIHLGRGEVAVPESILGTPCYMKDASRGADCFAIWKPKPTITTRWDSAGNHVPPLFYKAMSLFLGTDLWLSILTMRLVNVLLASLLLGGALIVALPEVRRALAIAWTVAIFPLGIFHMASTNPSGWAIMGIGTYWAFLATWLTKAPISTSRRAASLAGVAASGAIAVLGRSDSVIYIVAITLALIILRWRAVGTRPSLLVPFAALAFPAAFAATIRLPSAVDFVDVGRLLTTDVFTDLWYRIHLAEWPLLIAQIVGVSSPKYMPYPISYTAGMGWDSHVGTPIEMPSLVGIAGLSALFLAIGWGLTSYSWRKLVAAGVLFTVVFVMSFGWVVGSGFAAWAQSRYYTASLIALVGILTLIPMRQVPRPRLALSVLIWVLATTAGAAALETVIRHSTDGQPLAPDVSWLTFDAYVQWWWSDLPVRWLPRPNATALVGLLATALYCAGLAVVVRQPGQSIRAGSSRHTNQ